LNQMRKRHPHAAHHPLTGEGHLGIQQEQGVLGFTPAGASDAAVALDPTLFSALPSMALTRRSQLFDQGSSRLHALPVLDGRPGSEMPHSGAYLGTDSRFYACRRGSGSDVVLRAPFGGAHAEVAAVRPGSPLVSVHHPCSMGGQGQGCRTQVRAWEHG